MIYSPCLCRALAAFEVSVGVRVSGFLLYEVRWLFGPGGLCTDTNNPSGER